MWRIDVSVGGPWIPLNGPEIGGGWVDVLGVDADDPDVVYAGVREPAGSANNGRVFTSIDGGATWALVYTPSVPLYDMAARGDKVCLSGARGDETVLICSDDAGRRWSDLGAIESGSLVRALDIAISSEVSSTLLLAGRVVTITDGSDIDLTYGLPAVLRSTDGGDSWQRVLERPGNEGEHTAFYAIAQDPSTRDRFFVGGDDAWLELNGFAVGTIYRVEDGDWAGATQVYTAEVPGPILALAIDPTDGDVILASTLFGVLRSADDGDTWEEGELDKGGEHLAFSPAGDAYLATTDGTVYSSADGGQTWNVGVVVDDSSNEFAAGTHLFAGGQTDGVLRSTDGGATWAPSSDGITSLVSPRSLAWDRFDRRRLYGAGASRVVGAAPTAAPLGRWTWTATSAPMPAICGRRGSSIAASAAHLRAPWSAASTPASTGRRSTPRPWPMTAHRLRRGPSWPSLPHPPGPAPSMRAATTSPPMATS